MAQTKSITKTFVHEPNFRIFRANKQNTGYASSFKLSQKMMGRRLVTSLFLEMAKQVGVLDENGNANFAWRRKDEAKSSIIVKLGNNDIGEILAVLNGHKKAVGVEGSKYGGLFHKNSKGSAFIDFKVLTNPEGKPTSYSLEVGSKPDGAKDWTKYRHTISFAEGELLRVYFEMCLFEINEWFFKPANKYVTKVPAHEVETPPDESYLTDPNLTESPPDDIPF